MKQLQSSNKSLIFLLTASKETLHKCCLIGLYFFYAFSPLRNDLGDAEQVIDKLYKEKDKYRTRERELTSQIVGIEKDIEYMKDSLSRIEQLVTSK